MKTKILMMAFATALFLNSCSNKQSGTAQTSNSETKSKDSVIQRPKETEESLKDKVYKFDGKVADVSEALRNLKDNIDKGAKVTPEIDGSITNMIKDAKNLRESILPSTDKLAEEEFSHFDYDKNWIDKLDAEFESLRQTK